MKPGDIYKDKEQEAAGGYMIDAIFSIKHRYAEHIYSGHKCVELRRTAPKTPTERAWIYETAPIKRVTGWLSPA